MVLAESFLAEGARSRAGGTPTEVRLYVTEDEFESGGGFIENAGWVGVSAETSRRLACAAVVVEVVEDAARRALRTSRKTRSVPTGMRRALDVRDQHRCAFPSYTHTRFLDAHHIEHWVDGGATELDSLVLLCRRHHTFVHEYGYGIERTALRASRRHMSFRPSKYRSGASMPTSPRFCLELFRGLCVRERGLARGVARGAQTCRERVGRVRPPPPASARDRDPCSRCRKAAPGVPFYRLEKLFRLAKPEHLYILMKLSGLLSRP